VCIQIFRVLRLLAFKRFIAAVIILSLVGLATAWAFDSHAADSATHGQLSGAPNTEHHPDGDADDHGHDHCGHTGAHLVGLSNASRVFSAMVHSTLKPLPPSDLFINRTIAPPFKPPRS